MSLVFDALNQQAMPSTQVPTVAGSVLVEKRRKRLAGVMIAVAFITLASAAALLSQQIPVASNFPAPAEKLAAADADASTQTTQHLPQLATAKPEPAARAAVTVPKPIMQTQPVTQRPLDVVRVMSKNTDGTGQTSHQTSQSASTPKPPTPIEAPESEAVVLKQANIINNLARHSVSPGRLLTEFNSAMSGKRFAQAKQILEQSKEALGSTHLIVTRMEGYFGLQTGDSEQARRAYTSILSRLPSDHEAGYNLIILDWKEGAQNQARERLANMLLLAPDDQRLHHLQNAMEGRR